MLSYDFHTHILPGVDDGAKTQEEALKLISELSAQGIKNICLTSHYYSHKESMEDFLKRRDESAEALFPLIPEDINIKLGAEVYVTPYMFVDRDDFSPVCISGTNYMLAEFPYASSFQGESMRMLMRLTDLGAKIIIPHVERYPTLFKDKELLEELIYMGVVVQSNAASFLDKRINSKLIKLLKGGYIQILSSDTHSLRHNPPASLLDAQNLILKKCPGALSTLEENAREIWDS